MGSIITAIGAFLLKAVAIIAKVAKPIAKVAVTIAKAAPKLAAKVAIKAGASAATANLISGIVKVGEYAIGNRVISKVTRRIPEPVKSFTQDIAETALVSVLI